MMQQVNLLTEDLRPHVEPLTLRQLAAGWGVVVGVLLLVSAWQGLELWQLAGERAECEAELAALARSNAGLEAEVRSDPEPELVQEVESLRDEVAAIAESQTLLRTAIINGIERANQRVQDGAAGAGTTLAVVELNDGAVRPYHIGDSVVLVVGGRGKIKLQTVAHSPVGYGIESGLLDEDDAMHHGERHVISNFIGTSEMRIDIGSPLELSQRDTVVLASDGLFDNLHVEEVAEIVRVGKLSRAVAVLVTTARQRMENSVEGMPSKPDDLTIVAYRPSAPVPSAESETG